MRILLVTGKGGVGKTTISAATALKATDLGYRTLVVSTDPAHSLSDAFALPLGDEPREIISGLHAQQIDTQKRLESYWGEIRNQLMAIFDWGGVRGIEAEEFLVFPGMDELFALIEVRAQAISGRYDLVVVDCAPTAETLRLLSLPEVLSWYFDKIFLTQRRLMRAARPVLSRVTDLPLPDDKVYDAAENVFTSIERARTLLLDPKVTTARLVVNPERMVVNEARRTYTYLTLFGYAVDGVVVNRVLPDVVDDPYFERWREIQAEHLERINESFADVPVLQLRLFDDEMVGEERLRALGEELYGETDPITSYVGSRPFRVVEHEKEVRLELSLPFASGGDIDVMRDGSEVYVTVGPYRRSFVLPDSLQRREIAGARLSQGVLTIEFVER
ncbi:MAG: TRC40/GET3/ArsA family transport-energizing ATPase [Gammaproteobacteria bacterium]|nr:TRC40/GET3/ArsA family transport-energizing ATPase [Gammaproteobacteria bacterium]